MSRRRAWKWRLLELLLWVSIAVVVAVILTLLSDQVLAPNF